LARIPVRALQKVVEMLTGDLTHFIICPTNVVRGEHKIKPDIPLLIHVPAMQSQQLITKETNPLKTQPPL